jgi:hypothetical protein
MANYGDAAVHAAKLAQEQHLAPEIAWQRAVAFCFPNSVARREKGCPRGAFLGLCEEGLLRGVPRGEYTRSRKNKRYALDAVHALRRDPSLLHARAALWAAARGDEGPERQNGQVDVVVALWSAGDVMPESG